MRMTGGTVASGRGVEIGRGEPGGVEPGSRIALGIVGVLSTERTLGTALGTGGRLGIGARLTVGSTSGRGTITGSSFGEAIGAALGTESGARRTGPADSGVRAEPVHATAAVSTKTTSARIPTSPRYPNKQVFDQPTAIKRKQTGPTVQSASAGLTGLDASP
jgi:hypothetical protein